MTVPCPREGAAKAWHPPRRHATPPSAFPSGSLGTREKKSGTLDGAALPFRQPAIQHRYEDVPRVRMPRLAAKGLPGDLAAACRCEPRLGRALLSARARLLFQSLLPRRLRGRLPDLGAVV